MVRSIRRWHEFLDRPSAAEMASAMSAVSLGRDVLNSVYAEEFRAAGSMSDAALVYVHGGSFVAERSPRLTALIARLAVAARMPVLALDYRLAPEHPFPAAIDDVENGIGELLARGLSARRIAVVAESAGAAIALAALNRVAAKGAHLAGAVLLSPWVDLTLGGRNVRGTFSFTGGAPDATFICAQLYLQGQDPADPMASPVFGDLAGLPPIQIHSSRTDALRSDAALLAERLEAAGNQYALKVWRNGGHLFERFFGDQSDQSLKEAAIFLRRSVDRGQAAQF
jgi:acetyl esterase/lipase